MRYRGLARLAEQGATIHLVGIGGAGMAGLALLLQAQGAKVSGCDKESNETTRGLEERGMIVSRGHDPEHVAGCAAVVHTAAVPEDHPELAEARAKAVPTLKRSIALAELVSAGTLVAISGTHGKTTTTALTALALEAAGADPTALVGGRVPAWGGNARIGSGATFVVEADEYDRSFLALRPQIAVITSVEAEHLDTYGSFDEMQAAYDEFVDHVPQDGHVIACVDDAGARARLERAGVRGLGYGLGNDAMLRAESIAYEPERTRFSARLGDAPLGEFNLVLRGKHNVRNALAVLGVLVALGVEPKLADPAFASFGGVERRFQTLGEAGGVTIVDDYAHHPTEVAATLETARQVFADRRLVVAFQPHLYSRTRAFAGEFGRALAAADVVFVTDIYPAREAPIPGVSAGLVVDAAREEKEEERVHYIEELADLIQALGTRLLPGDVFMTLGAGDIDGVAHAVLDQRRRGHVDA
jgi:UDP-N-acetylmuramate--alanine ligase